MKYRLLPFALLLTVSLFVLAANPRALTQEGAPTEPKPRLIPALNAPDPYPSACVSCHVVDPKTKADGRLSSAMKSWSSKGASPRLLAKAQAAAPKGMKLTGKHPPIPVASVPGGCMGCHGRGSKIGPPMVQMIHMIHLTGEDNAFVKNYGGECTHCHKLNKTNGVWATPSAPEKQP